MKHHVVIADDNPLDFYLLQRAFECSECELHHVKNAAGLLQFLENSADKPALIICDYHMSDMNADEVIPKIKADERFSAIPIYIFSSTFSPYNLESIGKLNIRGFFEKPLLIEDTDRLIRRILKETGLM